MNCPLNNNPCSKDKCIHVTDINKDKIQELHLCNSCGTDTYKENIKGANKDSDDINDLPSEEKDDNPIQELLNLIANITKSAKPITHEFILGSKTDNKKCPKCNASMEDIIKVGRIGCSECYECFKQELTSAILKSQGELKHKGKIPKNKVSKNTLDDDLKLAIKEERYEDATILKRKIEQEKANDN